MIALLIFAYMAGVFALLWVCVLGIWVTDKIAGLRSRSPTVRAATPLLDKLFTILWTEPEDSTDASSKVFMIFLGLGMYVLAVALTVAISAATVAPWLPSYLMGLDPFSGLR